MIRPSSPDPARAAEAFRQAGWRVDFVQLQEKGSDRSFSVEILGIRLCLRRKTEREAGRGSVLADGLPSFS